MSKQITGSNQSIALDPGYAIRAPGMRGEVEMLTPRSPEQRSQSRSAEDGTDALDAALAAENVTEVRQIVLRLQAPPPSSGATRSMRSADGRDDLVEVTVPDLGPETGQIILACDASGVLTWHFPVDAAGQTETPATRGGGGGGGKRFLIPAAPAAAPTGTAPANRSLVGVLGKKLLKILVYPITDPVVGVVSDLVAGQWEKRKRPYGLRSFTPENFRTIEGPALTASDWQKIASGPALLFVHGTFSTAHGAFAGLPDATFKALYDRYEGRVLAFNHFSLSHDPKENAEWFLANLPAGRFEFDVICHSRGGLVARTLAEHPASFGLDTSNVSFPRVVCVGVPNNGTALASPDHMVNMIDRWTTALNVFPTGAVTETLEALIAAVKLIGHGALAGLGGLASMDPSGNFLKALNVGDAPGSTYYAVAADFEPRNHGLGALVAGTVADAAADSVFGDAENDLVVPQAGVFGRNGGGAFPIPDDRVLKIPAAAGATHITLFGRDDVGAKLIDWLA